MDFKYIKPLFTQMSNLTAAAQNGYFDIEWIFPTNFLDYSTNNYDNVVEYDLYRHIEIKTPQVSANGGGLVDASTYTTPFFSNLPKPEPIFKKIATIQSNLTQYRDTLSDLGIHNDEGIISNNGRWVDLAGNDILNDIYSANRRIYYKISAKYRKPIFNSTPFIYICHTDGVECRSSLTQVKWNTLYNEGDTIWFNSDIKNCNRTAVDLVFDVASVRHHNVWVSGQTSYVYCLDGRNGKLLKQYSLPFANIFGLRVDPSNGDCIVVGSNSTIYRCRLASSTSTQVRDINTAYSPNGNNGLVLTKENDNYFAHVVANQDTVSKNGLTTSLNRVLDRTNFGCSNSTNSNIPNVLGITNGPDQGVWVNGHVPINYVYSYSYTNYSNNCTWHSCCPGGSLSQYCVDVYYARGNRDAPSCRSESHYTCQQTSNTVNVNVNNNFLQDIGYVYGASEGINKNKTHGQSYPYGSGTYKPFTTQNRSGWYGKSDSVDNFGRPYTTSPNNGTNPSNSPSPALSQKGLATDYPTDGTLSGNTYDIFQVNESENKVHRLTWTGSVSTLDYNYPFYIANIDYWDITNPVHVATDSQNNMWVIQEGTVNGLTVIYQLSAHSQFPNGGYSSWPSLCSIDGRIGVLNNYVYGTPHNDANIEFYLTRDISFTSLLTTHPTDGYRNGYGVCLSGDLGEQRQIAREWLFTGNNYLLSGKRLYPNYTGNYSTCSFKRLSGDTTEYNSDNFGTCSIFAQQYIDSDADIAHPSQVFPKVNLKVSVIDSTPVNCDSTFWNDQKVNNTTNDSVTGYDNLQILLSADMIDGGSFSIQGYDFYFDDKLLDESGESNPVHLKTNNNYTTYIYHDPSINGKPGSRNLLPPAQTDGMYKPFALIATNSDAYYVSGDDPYTGRSNNVSAIVLEKWPTANFDIGVFDLSSTRSTYLTSWKLSSYNYGCGDNGLDILDDNYITSGYDPLSAQFNDLSISRSWPISDWVWTFGDKSEYGGFLLNNSSIGVNYSHVTSSVVLTSYPISQRDDCTTEHPNMVEHVYKGAGNYTATLWVVASNTNTISWEISSGVTDINKMISGFRVAATRKIKVLEVCPQVYFDTVTGQTVNSDYTDDVNVMSLVSAQTRNDGLFSSYGLISGYAPNLTVSFSGVATARSLPFSALKWDYSDPYNGTNYSDYTFFSQPTAGWPNWNQDEYVVHGTHTFVMPGFYSVTLVPIVSSPQVGYVSNCVGSRKNMNVFVQEIYPKSNFTIDAVSGISPLTITFNPSTVSAGSFPICRLDWNFGDGSDVLTLSRTMSSKYTSHNNISAYSDLSDPRNIVVQHTYNRTSVNDTGTFNATLSVYSCNTNSSDAYSKTIGEIQLAKLSEVEGEVFLVDSRMFNNDNTLLLNFEGQKRLGNYTVLLSAGGI